MQVHPAQSITPEGAASAFKLLSVPWTPDDHITATPIHSLSFEPPEWVIVHVSLNTETLSFLTVYRMSYLDLYPGGFELETLIERRAI